MASQPCPICKKPNSKDYQPFCSDRCSQIDLGNWLGERYAVPTEDPYEGVEEAFEAELRNSSHKL